MIYFNRFRTYHFVQTEYISTASNFVINTISTNRDDDLYRIIGFGKDGSGFYYLDQSYYYNADGVKLPLTDVIKHYWNALSGIFILDFCSDSSLSDNTLYNNCFSVNPLFEIEQVDGMDVTMTVSGFDENFQDVTLPITISLHLTPKEHYEFTSANVYVLINSFTNIFDSQNLLSQQYSTTLNPDGTVDILITVEIDAYTKWGWGYLSLGFKSLVGVLLRDSYDVSLSGTGVTFSNTSTDAPTNTPYVNVITVDSGYSLENASIVISMGGVRLNHVYNPVTQTITIPQVTGNIEISVIANKLHTFRFYSYDGLTLRASYTGIAINKLQMTLNGFTRTVTINDTNTVSWNELIPDNVILLGLSYTANSSRANLSLNRIYTETFNEDKDFYECLIIRDIPTGSFSITKYLTYSKEIEINKSLTLLGYESGTLREPCDLINPVITMEYSDVIDFNYVYIPYFKRYYFVTKVVNVNANIWLIYLKVDVLMTYSNLIRSQYGFVERNQFTFNADVIDNLRTFENEEDIEYVELQNSIFDVSSSGTTISGIDKDLRFILTIVGGN